MIDILLATYNGENYLNAQISSIVFQSYTDWNLIIHDDGSKDRTIDIIRDWVSKDDRIVFVEDGIVCGSAASNFMHLLQYSKSEYVMFCDQDDIWFDNKVEVMFNEILNLKLDSYRVVYSNSLVWLPEKGIKGMGTISFASDLSRLLFFNGGVQGCASIFDCSVRELMKLCDGEVSMHDHLLHLIAVSFGNCKFLDIPLMLYRNHSSNVTGSTRTKVLTISNIFYNNKRPLIDRKHYDMVKKFYYLYKGNLSRKDDKYILEYLQLPTKSFFYKLYVIFKMNFKLYNSRLLLFFKLVVRPYIN